MLNRRLVSTLAWLWACGADTNSDAACGTRGALLVGEGARVCARSVETRGAYDAVLALGRDDTMLLVSGPHSEVYRAAELGGEFVPVTPGGVADDSGRWLHPWLHRDPHSQRIFANRHHISVGEPGCSSASGTSVWRSDDDGATWQHASAGCGSFDWGKVVSGPPATAEHAAALRASGYPSVVYLCTTGPTLIVGPDHMCFRSFDGGQNFEPTLGLAASAQDNTGLLPIAFPQAGAVGTDGALYKTHASPSGVALKTSTDGGDTWSSQTVTGSVLAGAYTNFLSSNLTLGPGDVLYVSWIDDTDHLPHLSRSADRGVSWSVPLVLSPSEVRWGGYPNLSVLADGRVAIAYYGSLSASGSGDGYAFNDGRPYNAYLSIVDGAASTVVLSARFNASEAPVAQGFNFDTSEYLGAPIESSDGVIWASYVNGERTLVANLRLR